MTTTRAPHVSHDALQQGMDRAAGALRALRHADGYWEGRLASSALAGAVALCALADDEDPGIDRAKGEAWLVADQNDDGGWGDTPISKSNLAATLLGLCADARTATYRKQGFLTAEQKARAEAYVEKLGGLDEGLRRVYGDDLTFQVPIRMTAAASGLCDWRTVDPLPLELALAPRGLMGALGLPVVSYALPALVCVGLARHARAPGLPPLRWLRSTATNAALKRTLSMQPESGGFLEATPITAFCLLGLKSAGHGEHAIATGAKKFLRDSQRADGSWPVEVHLSIWNTTRALEALGEDGGRHGEKRDATFKWLRAQQAVAPHPYTGTAPGGWGWNHLSGSVPDADDTSGALIALAKDAQFSREAADAGVRWLCGLQNRDGGWPTFCRGWQKLPFDQSAPDLTAHALRALQAHGRTDLPAYAKGWRYLEKVQRFDGSFAPLWFGCEQAGDELNATYGTAHVLLACAGDEAASQSIAPRARAYLRALQHDDGGFGGCAGAPPSVEETGLALRALSTPLEPVDAAACARAAQWLLDRQRADGSWDAAPIGFYFAVLWYYEETYPLVYALGGLKALREHLAAPPVEHPVRAAVGEPDVHVATA